MKRWLPFPRLSAVLFIVWLLLNQTITPGHVLVALLLALATPQLLARLQPPAGHARRPIIALILAWRVLVDITRSNIAVAGILLRPQPDRNRTAGFVHIPLATRDPYALASLACIITATPGTIWVDYESASGTLIIHVLDLVDENAWIHIITQRYERLLREIFE
jgi:multicomponent K+:H+ antiporter subunit E